MPHKQATRPRAWGTRFDSLESSPPSSPSSQDVAALDADPKGQPADSPRTKEDRMPHDASVFVGSLPTNIEHQELTRLLSEHLSQYAEVKNIKVVRDAKGGVCAFVQCEDAPSAARLIQTLQTTPPEPFLGRFLRFEPARAFRALLISFRAPIQPVPSGNDEFSSICDYEESRKIELDLPTSIRLWRSHGAKYVSVLYNDEARQFDMQKTGNSLVESEGNPGDVFSGTGVFLSSLKFDQDTILKIIPAFGKVEQFCPYNPPDDRFDSSSHSYPHPHDAPRASTMDKRCWQVKWGHRDDCVNALMTLRRIPFLTVTWAHQPSSFSQENHYLTGSPTAHHSPRLPNSSIATTLIVFMEPSIKDEATPGTVLSSPLSKYPAFSDSGMLNTPSNMEYSRGDDVKRIDWSETDFPPLRERKSSVTRGISHAQNNGESLGVFDVSSETPSRPNISLNSESSVPSTPDFVGSPITPKTPGISALHTPDSQGSELDVEDAQVGVRNREVDPTTIFVGGLEMFGPHAWDEHRVRSLFERFGGIEDVRVVKPMNKKSAFAFVRFNNTEAPARAVAEEHNQTYDGRQIRVQLRDNNSHRSTGPYRYGYRGRGRGYQYGTQYGARPSFGNQDLLGLDLGRDKFDKFRRDGIPDKPVNGLASELRDSSDIADFDQPNTGTSVLSAELRFPSIQSSSADATPVDASSEDSPLRGARPSVSPPLSSVGSSVSAAAPVTPYPVAPVPYYTNPWMHGFGQPWSYPMPYMAGYAGPHVPGHHTPHSYPGTPGSSDASGPTSQAPWMGMYRPFIPYAPYPAQHDLAQFSLPGGQPPLRPTGFVQNEHGMLVPVYQPEALGQYMSNGPNPSLPPSNSKDGTSFPTWPHAQPPSMCPPPGLTLPASNAPSQTPNCVPVHPGATVPWGTQPPTAWPSTHQQHPFGPHVQTPTTMAHASMPPMRAHQTTMYHASHHASQQGSYAQDNHQKRPPRRGNHCGNGRTRSRRSSPDRFSGGGTAAHSTFEHPRGLPPHMAQLNSDMPPFSANGSGSYTNGNQWANAAR
ncbi:hypothetical protein GLOTRDRAFT_124137 [Gloeophyllum trabeum ATCC 11539]|uniref:RRM domain-containing protein n=1 Tax=Gloeophyllum trabeum (strain ATCC 11539 / FP-39264 / Madison 617) TaxID=670483 RepID=S7QLR1_GLOTA|nr:uncharacterized protein GLOTRDRAFT_124137 [Gloeophyllum trabeum ATCC 11539]EPQ60378.1 hypothetical protein GLOTRDRAFT_124137 [Gloeophyllum trabeum ATCC 11539]